MKVFLLWVVAAWVVAVTADRPCAEYCVYLSSGTRNIEFQAECDCMYQETELEDRLDDSGIYYEPVDFISAPAYTHNQPFYILNPIIEEREPDTDNNPENLQPLQKFYTEIELNKDDTHSTHNRQEKDINTNNRKLNLPLYLDIHFETGDERSASLDTFTAEEIKITEQSLLECTNLYAVLNSRSEQSSEIGITKIYKSNNYRHFSNVELKKVIQSKCSHISYIVENSLNEIKQTRPKLSSVTSITDSQVQQNNERAAIPSDIKITNKQTVCTSFTDSHLQPAEQNKHNEKKEHDGNQEQTTTAYSDFHKNIPDDVHTLPIEIFATTVASTSTKNTETTLDIFTKSDDISMGVTNNTIVQYSDPTITKKDTNYPLYKETITESSITVTEESLNTTLVLTSINTTEQELLAKRHSDQEYKATNYEARSGNRSHYKEGEIPLVKIVTHEFGNDTVQSYINGTEDIPNGDFNDERETTKVGNETGNSNNTLQHYEHNVSIPAVHDTNINNTEGPSMTADISGNLYFVFNNHQIPARFVQNLNGNLHLGIDGFSLCNELTGNGQGNSALLTTLCDCYKFGNCTYTGKN